MYAIYYFCPESGQRHICVSGRNMIFVHATDNVCGALYDRVENAQAAIRDYGRVKIEQKVAAGYPLQVATLWNEAARQWVPLPGAEDPSLKNFRIVPVTMTPNFEGAIQVTPNSRRRKP